MTFRSLTLSLFCALTVTSCAPMVSSQLVSRPPSSKDPLQLAVSAYIAAAPGQIIVYTRTEPDPRSRVLTIEWWSTEGEGGSHQITLEGAAAPPRHDYSIKRLSQGNYLVTAVLTMNDGTQLRKQANVLIVGEGGRIDAMGTRSAPGEVTLPRTPW